MSDWTYTLYVLKRDVDFFWINFNLVAKLDAEDHFDTTSYLYKAQE
jgi:hypothetical protein